MRVSQLLLPTLREVPAEAEVISHRLLLRAGFMRKAAAGIYTLLPLAWRVILKIERIIREELDRQGGQEIMMPIMQPAELWQESGRWDVYGPELFRLKDRHGRDFCLGPTHEEIITALVRGEVNSYKQLPLLLYQIQNKYRDERRPRFGLMRGREFIMKDLYSFDRDEAGLDVSYNKMFEAYTNVFRRCGLQFRPVVADSGAIGGSDTHEFMVLAESGEATIVYCTDEQCGYAANEERAEAVPPAEKDDAAALEPKKVHTPDCRTMAEVATFFKISPARMIKTIIYTTEKETVAAMVRGDREINEIKLYNALDCIRLEMAGEETVRKATGASAGYAGPVNLTGVRLVADPEVMALANAVCGANENDHHLVNINPGRDFTPDLVTDIRLVKAGEPCPVCGTALQGARGIEVGQIFKLGDKYSKALGATFLDENGKARPFIMGCYGIGVTRTMAAAVEQNHDERGIIWPVQIAPFHVIVVPVSHKDQNLMETAEKIYHALNRAGVESVVDDRPDRAGVKFNDADLVGYPIRITVGAKGLAAGKVELYLRRQGETIMVPLDEVVETVKAKLQVMGH
ncbi:proline--tRNA ligase [Desulfoscipio geothermicus]|uniref:Proline--tRNA ligase n=1 Tax=Desulfoscipio geothermicus DSM 3669 TaxID=1121426 RepID=A0A1I6D8M6_9FIRM|nr:proline--tRNA ligase [Desulfoscipio geothermicus]SFR01692.1 prolyl-tRNA synthetase [Desulfoscipio geothermicus DSM 3669]